MEQVLTICFYIFGAYLLEDKQKLEKDRPIVLAEQQEIQCCSALSV